MTDATRSSHELAAEGGREARRAPDFRATPWYSWAMVAAFEAAMLPSLARAAASGAWSEAALILLVMGTVISPAACRRWAPLRLPVPLEMALVAFFFGALFLGEVLDFYERFRWWDMLLHGSSGVLFSATGLVFAYGLERQHGRIELAPRVAFLFAPMFAMSVGTFWEFFEFALQSLSGLPIQVPQMSNWSGLTDTMWDLVLNAAGAILVAAWGWYRFRPGRASAVPGWVARFLRENPRFLAGPG